jgi:hypothetical protein
MPDLTEADIARTDFGAYTADDFFDDMLRVTRWRCDGDLVTILVERSFATIAWLHAEGVRFQPSYGRQAFRVDGRFKFWGGLAVEAWGGGPGLIGAEIASAQQSGIEVRYNCRATEFLYGGERVPGRQGQGRRPARRDPRAQRGPGRGRLRSRAGDADPLSRRSSIGRSRTCCATSTASARSPRSRRTASMSWRSS